MAEKKKILYIVEAMGGGVFTYIVDLANELVNKYDMYIAYAVRKQTPKNYKDYFDKRIHLIEVKNFGRAIDPVKDIAAFFEVKKIAAEIKPDIIHLHSSKAGAIGRMAFNGKIPMFYLKDDVLPLTKEGAREWHRLGERIYPLFQDGTAGDFASQEEIEQHDGIFGIKADAWSAILLEKNEEYLEDEYARPDAALTVISREQALRLFDEGKQIYLIRISPWPVLVTGREEIERGSDYFQIAIADLEQERNMAERENMLLYGSEKQFGIYQITERDPEHDYRFMGLDYVEKKGITVTRADYDLIYAAPLTEKDTLDGIYERFNIQRPADFTGHSLSVSDVVVLNDGSTVKAWQSSVAMQHRAGSWTRQNCGNRLIRRLNSRQKF